MDIHGLAICSRYAYPPNSLALCGPDKQKDLQWYSKTLSIDKGSIEILSQFSTLYPYLILIAKENNLKDPFDKKIVEAYWVGNSFLHFVPISEFVRLMRDTFNLRKKIKPGELNCILEKIGNGAVPHHAFHVLNIYKRTGYNDSNHVLKTMDACIINLGKVIKIQKNSFIINTRPLIQINNRLVFGSVIERTIYPQGEKDAIFQTLQKNDWISYHWGYLCQKLHMRQLQNLIVYTNIALHHANTHV